MTDVSSSSPSGAGSAPMSGTLDAYEVVANLGRGSFGLVSKVRRKADGRILVWKEMHYGRMREKERELVVSEVNILRELRHPCIVRYYDRIIDKASTTIYIVMEMCEGGDLGAVLKQCKKDKTMLDEEFVWRVFAQTVAALKSCHRHKDAAGKLKPVLHRDLKPGNLFLDAEHNIKVGDFGLAKELSSESKLAFTSLGTPFYMSPEMINLEQTRGGYDEKSDIWALGCLIYELCALAPPFDATNHMALAVKINAGKFARIPAQYSDTLYRAIRWMLSLKPSDRPSVEDLEKLPRVKAGMREIDLLLREQSLAQQTATKQREWRTKEEELAKRETDVARRESAVAAAERSLADRQSSLASRGQLQPLSSELPAKRRPSIGFGGVGSSAAMLSPAASSSGSGKPNAAYATPMGTESGAGKAYITPLGLDSEAPCSPPASAVTEAGADAGEVRSPPLAMAGGQLFSYSSADTASPQPAGYYTASSSVRTPPLYSVDAASAFAPVSARPSLPHHRPVDGSAVPSAVVGALASRLASASLDQANGSRSSALSGGGAGLSQRISLPASAGAAVAASGYTPSHLAISIGRSESPAVALGTASVNTTAASISSTASGGTSVSSSTATSTAAGYAARSQAFSRAPSVARRVAADTATGTSTSVSGLPLRVSSQPQAGALQTTRQRDCTLGPTPQLRRPISAPATQV